MKYFILFILIVSACWACSEDELQAYDSGRYIYFTEGIADSISESFFFYPGESTHDIKLPLQFAGMPVTSNMTYKVVVDETFTTGVKGTDFDFNEEQIWRNGFKTDTMTLTLKKTDKLATQMIRVVLKLVPSDDFNIGPKGNVRSQRVIFTSKAIAPTWWNSQIIEYYLGTYSEAKYAKFIEVTGISDMSGMGPTDLRYYSLVLKYHLIDMENAGTSVMDEGNVPMTVPING